MDDLDVVLSSEDGLSPEEVEEICEGKIGYEFIGDGGFGYDPIFVFGDRTFAQMTADEKDKFSHRGKALRELRAELEKEFS